MKQTITTTKDTGTGPVTVTETIDYETPKAGDTIYCSGFAIKIKKDPELRLVFDYDPKTRKYTATPMRDANGNLVFIASGVTWRKGKHFTKQTD